MSHIRMTPERYAELQARNHPQVKTIHVQAPKFPPKPGKQPSRSNLEVELQAQIEKAGFPTPEYDVPYLIGTRHRLDVCWRDRRFGVEVQGMVHRIKGRFKADITKRAIALLQGWTVLEVDGETIANGKAIEWIGQLLKRYDDVPGLVNQMRRA